MKWQKIGIGVIGFGLAAVASASGIDGLEMGMSRIFSGEDAWNGIVPIRVHFDNAGDETSGNLLVQNSNCAMTYPVKLKGHGSTVLTVYTTLDSNSTNATLQTSKGSIDKSLFGSNENSIQRHILLISNNSGSLDFLVGGRRSPLADEPINSSNGDRATPYAVNYVQPGDAPDRAICYSTTSAIILGPGSENLSDSAVKAIQEYVLTGGSLMFTGGQDLAVLNDARWKNLLPVRNVKTVALTHTRNLSEYVDELAPNSVSVTQGILAGADSKLQVSENGKQIPLIAEKSSGLGTVTFLAVDFFSGATADWGGRKTLLMKALGQGNGLKARAFLQESSTRPTTSFNPNTVAKEESATPVAGAVQNPFNATLPPATQVFAILCSYFLAVIPINFLILKKFNRGELAWVTAPAISLVFAGVLFSSAHGLYSAKLSTASQGILLAEASSNEGIFIGKTQMFFPSSGNYSLNWDGLQRLTNAHTTRSNGNGVLSSQEEQGDLSGIQATDTGQISVAQLSVPNLAFREFSYTQHIPLAHWFAIKKSANRNNLETYTVTNASPYELAKATLTVRGRVVEVYRLTPGSTETVSLPIAKPVRDTFGGPPASSVLQFTSKTSVPVLCGELVGFRPGPQIGSDFKEYSHLSLAFFGDNLQ